MLLFTLCLAQMSSGIRAAEETAFSLNDHPDQQHLDIMQGERLAGRYMYAYDPSTSQSFHKTYKPFLHVYDRQGDHPITKGPGGRYSHHRGIFIGWNRLRFEGKAYDRWHMNNGAIVHQKFKEQSATEDRALFTAVIHWNNEDGEPMLREERTMVFRRGPDWARLQIDLLSTLQAEYGKVTLDGDPEHGGIQFRPVDDIEDSKTVYTFHKAGINPRKDLDLPWVAETFTMQGNLHTVVHMNHPSNPDSTRYSAYRDYGRFGAFFTKTIPANESLTIQYRFLVIDGEMPPIPKVQEAWADFAEPDQPVQQL